MQLLEHCPKCGRGPRLIVGERLLGRDHVVEFQYCPRCKWEALGDVRPGTFEIDEPWSVVLGFVRTPTNQELLTLRNAHPSIRQLALSEMLAIARARGEIRVDDLTRPEVVTLTHIAEQLGLTCRTA